MHVFDTNSVRQVILSFDDLISTKIRHLEKSKREPSLNVDDKIYYFTKGSDLSQKCLGDAEALISAGPGTFITHTHPWTVQSMGFQGL